MALCIYELEKKCHFTGESILTDNNDSDEAVNDVKESRNFEQENKMTEE